MDDDLERRRCGTLPLYCIPDFAILGRGTIDQLANSDSSELQPSAVLLSLPE